MMVIHIDRLRLYGYHGVMEQESKVGCEFYYTLHCRVDVSDEAAEVDKLEGTISYADIYALLKEQNAIRAKLLEHLVHRTLKTLLKRFPLIKEATLRIDKENPPMGALADSIGVEETLTQLSDV